MKTPNKKAIRNEFTDGSKRFGIGSDRLKITALSVYSKLFQNHKEYHT